MPRGRAPPRCRGSGLARHTWRVASYDETFLGDFDFGPCELPGGPPPRTFYYPGASPIRGHDRALLGVKPAGAEPWIGMFADGGLFPSASTYATALPTECPSLWSATAPPTPCPRRTRATGRRPRRSSCANRSCCRRVIALSVDVTRRGERPLPRWPERPGAERPAARRFRTGRRLAVGTGARPRRDEGSRRDLDQPELLQRGEVMGDGAPRSALLSAAHRAERAVAAQEPEDRAARGVAHRFGPGWVADQRSGRACSDEAVIRSGCVRGERRPAACGQRRSRSTRCAWRSPGSRRQGG